MARKSATGPKSTGLHKSVKRKPLDKHADPFGGGYERRKNRGAVIVSRCLTDHPDFGVHRPYHLAALLLILSQTAFKPWVRDIAGAPYHLDTGDVVMPRLYLAARLKCSEKHARKILDDMVKEGFLSIKTKVEKEETKQRVIDALGKGVPGNKGGPQLSGTKGHNRRRKKVKKGRKYDILSVAKYREYQDWGSYKGHNADGDEVRFGPQYDSDLGQNALSKDSSNKLDNITNTPLTPQGAGRSDNLDHDVRQIDIEDLISGVAEGEGREAQLANGKVKAQPVVPKIIGEADVDWALGEFRKVADEFGLPQPRKDHKLSAGRRKNIRDRLTKDGGREAWSEAMAEVRRSKFLTGRAPKKFKVDLQFVVQAKSFVRLVEGFYSHMEGFDPEAERKRQEALERDKKRQDEQYRRLTEAARKKREEAAAREAAERARENGQDHPAL